MRRASVVGVSALIGVLVFLATPALTQQVYYPDFSSLNFLKLNGAQQATYNGQKVLRLTQGYSGLGVPHPESATTWFTIQQPVAAGFTTYFQFQIHDARVCCTPGDGLAFVVQTMNPNTPNGPFTNYGAIGSGITARGISNGGLGYAGILNSLAVEFDTAANAWDQSTGSNPNPNHVAVQSCGAQTNDPVHFSGNYPIYQTRDCLVGALTGTGAGINSNIPTLGVTCGTTSCADGAPHTVVIEYTPPAVVNGNGTLMVWIDPPLIQGTHTPMKGVLPAINIPYNIDGSQNSGTGLSLAQDPSGKFTAAYVGFTASQTNQPQQQDILAWEFTPHTATEVQQVIQGCAPNTHCQPAPTVFPFGAHITKVTYFQDFVNNPNNPSDPILMTVTATPWSRNVFYQQRLLGTSFANEQCVVYLGTGNKCMVYSITCQLSSNPTKDIASCPTTADFGGTCNKPSDAGCIKFSTFYYTTDGITANNADYLSAHPIGSNAWQSIFLQFLPNVIDSGTVGGKGTSSDFVTTFKLGLKP